MKIVLTGFMGSGKSTVAAALAAKLGFELIEMDSELIKISGYKSIPEIFSHKGETFFRELELQVARNFVDKDDVVISAGGGVIMNKLTMDYLKKNAIAIFLKTSFAETKNRLKNMNNRPLFKNPAEAKKLFEFRKPLYEYYADCIIYTDKKTVDEIVREILKNLGAKL